MTRKVYSKKCDKCSKVISSIYPEQFEYNWEQHKLSHERKGGSNK